MLGTDFRGWINAIYGDIEYTVQVNGYLSVPFVIERTVSHGCPCLFSVCTGPGVIALEAGEFWGGAFPTNWDVVSVLQLMCLIPPPP